MIEDNAIESGWVNLVAHEIMMGEHPKYSSSDVMELVFNADDYEKALGCMFDGSPLFMGQLLCRAAITLACISLGFDSNDFL